MTKHPGTPKEEGRWRGKRERKKERKKRGEMIEKEKAGVPSYEQSSRDTPKKERGDPESSIQEGRGRRGD